MKNAKDTKKDEKPNDKPTDEEVALRSGGVSGVAADSTRSQQAEQDRLQRDPPPLAHVNPVTGEVLTHPLETSTEPNRLTVPGDGGVKDARPNNGQLNTGNPNTDKAK